jgi:hypothetical protein
MSADVVAAVKRQLKEARAWKRQRGRTGKRFINSTHLHVD